MSWEQEKPTYIEKLKKITGGIEKILSLKGNRIVTHDIAVQLKRLRDDAARMLPKLEKDEFEIAVVGQESLGVLRFHRIRNVAPIRPPASAPAMRTGPR